MNQKILSFFCVILCSFAGHALNAKNGIDPISDFSTPQSLTEMLKEGLLQVKNLVEHSRQPATTSTVQSLQEVHDLLKSLHQTCQSHLNSSRLHAIYKDDKEMLQSLLDRINQLLESLGDQNVEHADQNRLIQENMNLISEFKDVL